MIIDTTYLLLIIALLVEFYIIYVTNSWGHIEGFCGHCGMAKCRCMCH